MIDAAKLEWAGKYIQARIRAREATLASSTETGPLKGVMLELAASYQADADRIRGIMLQKYGNANIP